MFDVETLKQRLAKVDKDDHTKKLAILQEISKIAQEKLEIFLQGTIIHTFRIKHSVEALGKHCEHIAEFIQKKEDENCEFTGFVSMQIEDYFRYFINDVEIINKYYIAGMSEIDLKASNDLILTAFEMSCESSTEDETETSPDEQSPLLSPGSSVQVSGDSSDGEDVLDGVPYMELK